LLLDRITKQLYKYAMARPSRHVDRALLVAGRDLYAEGGAATLTVRRVAERAGANPAMVRYHFGSRDAFLRQLLQSIYEEMFADLEVAAGEPRSGSGERLRAALRVIARFVRDNRRLLAHLLRDAMSGEAAALDFARANAPRHLGLVGRLVAEGQREGALRAVPLPQALAFVAGAMGAPILAAAAIGGLAGVPSGIAQTLDDCVLSDAALDERIDLVLAGLAARVP
jgi:AcrR family transcriptional regulator